MSQIGLILASGSAAAQNDVEAFDGSFRLQTGEVIEFCDAEIEALQALIASLR